MSRGSDFAGASGRAGAPQPAESRLRPCPDCGKIISRRARECPSCGCPIPAEPPSQPPGRRGRRLVVLSILGVVLVALIAGGVYLASLVKSLGRASEAFDLVTEPLAPEPAAEPVPETRPGPARPTPAQIAAAKQQAAAAAAREVDQRFARDYAAVASLSQVHEQLNQYAELSQSLSDGTFTRPGQGPAKKPPPAPPQPYRSQYDALLRECLAYLDAQVPKDLTDLGRIQVLAQTWAIARRSPVEQQFLGGQVTP